jgi:hypothetical protein
MIWKRPSHKSTFVDIAKVDRVLFWQSCALSGFNFAPTPFPTQLPDKAGPRLARTKQHFKLTTSVGSTSHVLPQISLEVNFTQA